MIPTEKRLAKELREIFLLHRGSAEESWVKVAQNVRKLMKAHGAAMYQKGKIS